MRPVIWFVPGLVLGAFVVCFPGEAAGVRSGAIAQRFPPDARSRGMGDAFTALAEGPAAVWWNPAALATGPALALEPYGRSRLVPDLADDIWIHYFSAAGQQRGLGVGANLNYLNYGAPYLPEESDEQDEEYALRVGTGVDLTHFVAPEAERFKVALGASWNRFVVDYRLFSLFPPPGVTREHATAWDMDVGALATFCTPIEPRPSGMRPSNYILRGGLVVGNVFDHELDLVTSPNTPVGKTFRAGLAARVETSWIRRTDTWPASESQRTAPPNMARPAAMLSSTTSAMN